jgi:hypothetical protein
VTIRADRSAETSFHVEVWTEAREGGVKEGGAAVKKS